MGKQSLLDREPQSHFSVERAAKALGVSPRRVRALLANGQLEGHREGGVWFVNRRSVAERAGLRVASNKSLSPRSMELLVELLSQRLGADEREVWLCADAVERHRAKLRVNRLALHERPAALLRAWASLEASHVHELEVSDDFARGLVDRGSASVSGISHALSFMSPSMALEVHVAAAERRRIEREADAGRVRLILHSPPREWSVGEVPVDLSLHNRSREDADVRRILAGAR